MLVSPLEFTLDSQLPKMMVLVGGAFGRCLIPEGAALMNGISALMKEAPECSPAPPTTRVGTQQEACDLREGPHSTRLHPDLALQPPGLGGVNFCGL